MESSETIPASSAASPTERERREFALACAWLAALVISNGAAYLYSVWKTHQLMAAGRWPRDYGQAVRWPAMTAIFGMVCLAAFIAYFLRWLVAIRQRRKDLPVP